MAPSRARPGQHTDIVDEDRIDELLDALEDRDCRAILEATSDQTLSASELSEACDLPLSTTYRKVDKLTEAGLLEEQVRLSTTGKHTSEYAVGVSDIRMTVDSEHGVALRITHGDEFDVSDTVIAGAD